MKTKNLCLFVFLLSLSMTLSSLANIAENKEWTPDYLVIGAQKSASTSLYAMICQHPMIMEEEEEIHFFDINFSQGVQWYQNKWMKKILSNPNYYSFNHQMYSYLARGVYLEQIKRWLEYYPEEQMLFLSTQELKDSAQDTLNKVFSFLNLENYPVTPVMRLKSYYKPINPLTRKQLSEYFHPHNVALEDFLGIKFNWE